MKKRVIVIVVVLVALAVTLGCWNRKDNQKSADLIIGYNGITTNVSYEDIHTKAFSGEQVNGKGERTKHDYEGVSLLTILNNNKIDVQADMTIVVNSEDNYSAELTGSEVLDSNKVYIALSADGKKIESIDGGQGAQLIVFGDKNSKRAVRYMKEINIK